MQNIIVFNIYAEMKCVLKLSILLITIRCIKSENQTEPQTELYSYSVMFDIYSKLKQLASKNHVIIRKNETGLQPILKTDSYYGPITYEITTEKSTGRPAEITTKIITRTTSKTIFEITSEITSEIINENTTGITTGITDELINNLTNTLETTEGTITSEATLTYLNAQESTPINDSVHGIIPAMPGIPIFREPPEIMIHDPDEGPLDPYYHPSHHSDEYPTTLVPDQQFIFIQKPEFAADKGSLEERYKYLLSDKNDDITSPPRFDGENIFNYTEIEKMILTITTTTMKPENTSIRNYFLPQIPYPYSYTYDRYLYGFAPFMPSYNLQNNIRSPFVPPTYPEYYSNENFGKQETGVEAVNSDSAEKADIEEEKADPRYRSFPKIYTTHGAQIGRVSFEDKGLKDLTAGDSDSLEVFGPLELRQEKQVINKISQNIANKTTIININDNNKLINKSAVISQKNIKTCSHKLKNQVNNKRNNGKITRLRTDSKRTKNRNQTNKNKSTNRNPKTRNNNKRTNTRLLKILVKNNNKTNSKFPKSIEDNRKKNKFIDIENHDFNRHKIYFPFDTTLSPLKMHLIITMNRSLKHTIPTRNPSRMRINNRRLISRQQYNRPLIKKSKNKNSAKTRQKNRNVKNPKTIHWTTGRLKESVGRRDPIRKIDWKQTKSPEFLLRAKLLNINQLTDDIVSTNKWWTLEQPSYCLDPIYVVNDCKNQKLTKRWSYSANDQKCYFYQDYCSHVRNNSFLTSQECFRKCWRVRKSNHKIEGSIKF